MSQSSQAELDLLADGRDVVERWCESPRYRYLYPGGPNLAILLEAYQELDRRRLLGRIRNRPATLRRALRRTVRRLIRRDALARNRRLRWSYPEPRVRRTHVSPLLVQRALAQVDPDARPMVSARVEGGWAAPDPSTTLVSEGIMEQRGLDQFREALINEALAHPTQLAGLHPQFIAFTTSPAPQVRRYPIAGFLLVTLPLRLLAATMVLLTSLYVGAYLWFNDERLGEFVSDQVSGLVEGELRMASIHWELSLIADLLTGSPTHVEVEQVAVCEPGVPCQDAPERASAFVPRMEASLTLHEIIPWNRLGVPEAFEIPWVLHMSDIHAPDRGRVSVWEYDDGRLSVLDAFVPSEPTDPESRGLSFHVDNAHLSALDLDIDFMHEGRGWAVASDLRRTSVNLRFDAPRVEDGTPPRLPFRFLVSGPIAEGRFVLDDIEVPLERLNLRQLACGMGQAALGDVGFDARGLAGNSPINLHGTLFDAFGRDLLSPDKEPPPADASLGWGGSATVELSAHVEQPLEPEPGQSRPDPPNLVAHLERELGLTPDTIDASRGELWATVTGPLAEPRYHLAAEDLSLDFMGEPAWTMDDVELSVDIGEAPVPARWRAQRPRGARRLVAQFDHFQGSALDGTFMLDPEASEGAVIVFPEGDESWLIAAPLWLDGINPAQLSPDDEEIGALLAGAADGRLDLRRLEFGPPLASKDEEKDPPDAARGEGVGTGAGTSTDPKPDGSGPDPNADAESEEDSTVLHVVEMQLADVQLTRDRGPREDGMPHRLRADGTVIIDADGAIDLDGLVLRTDGTTLTANGGVDGELDKLQDTLLDLRIDDGSAFARAFALPSTFDTLHADMSMFGSLNAPSGRGGTLDVTGVGVAGGRRTTASMSMRQGVLRVQAPRAQILGGNGSIDAEITLMRGGTILDDPLLRATVELDDVELSTLAKDAGLSGPARVSLTIGDAQGKAVPFSRLEVRGEASVPNLRFAGTRYHDAEVKFSLLPEQLLIEELVLPVHRAVSPFHDASLTVPIGKIVAHGTVGLESDPSLDLDVEAEGVPLRLVAELLDLDDLPVRGRIGRDTRLDVSGSVRRPRVEGRVNLLDLSTEGVALGSGTLEFTNQDLPDQGPLAAHRELRVSGELATPEGSDGIQWTIDAVVALGETPRSRRRDSGMPAIDAEVDVRFDQIALQPLLRGLDRGSEQDPHIMGTLDELEAHILSCDPGAAMLTDCVGDPHTERSFEVKLSLDKAWIGGHEPITTDPCQDPTILCAPAEVPNEYGTVVDNRLDATIDWPNIELNRTWHWRTGGRTPAEIRMSGNVDLSAPTTEPLASALPARKTCDPPPLSALRPQPAPPGAARAEVNGELDMAVLAELLGLPDLQRAQGRLSVDLALDGPASALALSGEVSLPENDKGPPEPLTLETGSDLTVSVGQLDLRIDEYWLAAEGQLRVLGEPLRFGSVGSEHTGLAFGGACEGNLGVAASGSLSARIINAIVGEGTATKGAIQVPRVRIRGNYEGDPLDRTEATIRLGKTSLTLDLDEGLPGVELTDGRIDLALCSTGRCPTEIAEGSIAMFIGGRDGAESDQRPSQALRAKIGPRGSAFAWGTAYMADDASSLDGTRVVLQLEDVPYRDYDLRGRPIYEAEMTSSAVTLEGGTPLVVAGQVDVDRARYVLDAVQGVEILRFTDDVDLPSAPPPDIIRNLQFDLQVRTHSPLRVENNVAHGVEADAIVDITGTYDTPEFTGRIDVEPGGTVDIPFLTGTYEIQRGRVTLLRELADAEVDVLARRKELVYIEDQPREVYLLLGGTADAITWQCIAQGDTSGAVDTQAGCLDYLVLGAGDVQTSALAVQNTGGGGLANARKPLQVVGHVTEFDFGRRIEDAVPRISPYVPDMRLRLGQIGPELEIATPQEWLDFDYAHGTAALDYTRGYPGFLLRQSRELNFKLEAIDLLIFEVSRDIRSYLNNRIIFDPLRQTTIEFRVDFEIPSLR